MSGRVESKVDKMENMVAKMVVAEVATGVVENGGGGGGDNTICNGSLPSGHHVIGFNIYKLSILSSSPVVLTNLKLILFLCS
ncbi:hypothetical protein RIF29_38937 [Crotalaria pallida]|uniref:Uncharacterized protein n=1 Tax=Crotalaria pallida TaxID=3830 RepID=A0AAN9E0R5_CROPI